MTLHQLSEIVLELRGALGILSNPDLFTDKSRREFTCLSYTVNEWINSCSLKLHNHGGKVSNELSMSILRLLQKKLSNSSQITYSPVPWLPTPLSHPLSNIFLISLILTLLVFPSLYPLSIFLKGMNLLSTGVATLYIHTCMRTYIHTCIHSW